MTSLGEQGCYRQASVAFPPRLPSLTDVLHLEFAGGAVFLEGLNLDRKCAGQFVQHGRGTVLQRNGLDTIEAAGGPHGRFVNRRHLNGDQGFGLIPRVDPPHDGEQEVQLFFRRARLPFFEEYEIVVSRSLPHEQTS